MISIDNITKNVSIIDNKGIDEVIGDGYFDNLMETITKHLSIQYDNGRIKGEQYPLVYADLLKAALQVALQADIQNETLKQDEKLKTLELNQQKAMHDDELALQEKLKNLELAQQKLLHENELKQNKELKTLELNQNKELKTAELSQQKLLHENELKQQKELKTAELNQQKLVNDNELKQQKELKTAELNQQKLVNDNELKQQKELKTNELAQQKLMHDDTLRQQKELKTLELAQQKELQKPISDATVLTEGAKTKLYERQTKGFDDDAKIKTLKELGTMYGLAFSVAKDDPNLVIPKCITGNTLDNLASDLLDLSKLGSMSNGSIGFASNPFNKVTPR